MKINQRTAGGPGEPGIDQRPAPLLTVGPKRNLERWEKCIFVALNELQTLP